MSVKTKAAGRGSVNKKIAAPVISAAVFGAVALLHFAGAFAYVENRSYDMRVRFSAPFQRPSRDIAVVLVDQPSIEWATRERGWPWPWPREAYAEMLDFLYPAASVTFDIIFSDPSIHGGADDEAFASATAEHGRAAHGVFFSSRPDSEDVWHADIASPLFEPDGFGGFLASFGLGQRGTPLSAAQFPIPALRASAAGLGSLTGVPDPDGIIRRMRLFTLFDGKAVPALAAIPLVVSGHADGLALEWDGREIAWGDFRIPAGADGASLLRFRGDPARYFPVSAKNILESRTAILRGEPPFLEPGDFEGMHVFVGFFAPGLFDIFSTPISALYPGMGVHITMLDNILQGDFIRRSGTAGDLAILLAAVVLVVALCLFSRRVLLSTVAVALAAIAAVVGSFAAYHWLGLWVPMATFLVGIAAASASTILFGYATEGSQRRFIKTAFSQYLSPAVIERIIADPSQLRLGGEKNEMTAIFTDVRAFSTISEALRDPQKLVELLNFYLTRMSDIILANQGTIDKYEGDAIIAFFGAPARLSDHAALACRSAVQMKKAEAEVNRRVLELGLITAEVTEALAGKGLADGRPLFTRMGINSGEMVVGNMGTPNKMNYTIMGNAVNLAARLEGVNKVYDTGGILISEHTRAQIGDGFAVRPLSRVRVVGINEPLRLFELLDTADEADPALSQMVGVWERALILYEGREFATAAALFAGIAADDPADAVARKYRDRCLAFVAAPPAGEWDAVDNLTEK